MAKGVKPLAESNASGLLRQQIDRNAAPLYEHEVEGADTAHLVGEIGPVSRASVTGLRNVDRHLRQSARGVVVLPASSLLRGDRERRVGHGDLATDPAIGVSPSHSHPHMDD